MLKSIQLKALTNFSSKNINIFKLGIYNNPKLLLKNEE